jgi:hypothetical protein
MLLLSDDGAHAVTYELGWRELADPSTRASRAVRLQAGHNLKSSVTYTYRFDSFAEPMLPYDGFGIKCDECEPICTHFLARSLLRSATMQRLLPVAGRVNSVRRASDLTSKAQVCVRW